MTALDIVILACFLPAIWTGLKKGLIHQLVGVAIVVLSIWLGLHFSEPVAGKLSEIMNTSELGLKLASFAVIFLATAASLKVLGVLIEKLVKLALLGWLNKLLGVVLAVLKYALIICLVIMLFDSINSMTGLIKPEKLEPCIVYNFLKNIAYTLFQWKK